MKSQRGLSTIKLLAVGIAIGIAITILLGLILCYVEGDPLSIEPKTFGDVKIWAEKTPDEVRKLKLDFSKALCMRKSGKTFLVMLADASGNNVKDICLLDREGNVILTLCADTDTWQWKRLIYTRYKWDPVTPGEVLTDLNVDGQFDSKYTVDNTGKATDRYIYTGGAWIKIEEYTENAVISEGKRYIFDVNNGWYPE